MCLVRADSHVYKVHICVHMCNTRYSSNLLLWLLLMIILVSALFFFSSWFPVDELCRFSCSRELKKGRWLLWFFTVLFQGFVDILMKPFFFLLLTVMLWCWSWLSVSLLFVFVFLSGPVVKFVWKLNKAIHWLCCISNCSSYNRDSTTVEVLLLYRWGSII